MTPDRIDARIKNLPPLPLVAHKLVTMMQQDSCSASDVTKVLTSDQALTGKVLRLANSSFYGLSGKVGSVSRAVVILGFAAIRSMALGLGIAQAIKSSSRGLDLAYFWTHALYTAAAARTIASENNRVDPEEAFVAGLVHDLGLLVLEMEVPDLEARLADTPGDQRLAAEAEVAGMAHTKAGQKVMRHWQLPRPLVTMARFHHHATAYRDDDEDGLIAYVMLGELVARGLGHCRESGVLATDPAPLAAHLGISLRETPDLLARTHQEVGRTRAFLDVAGLDIELAAPLAALDAGSANPEVAGTAVFLGSDAERAGWVHGLLDIQAWRMVGMRPFLAGEVGPVDLAIVDPHAITPEQAGKLRAVLAERGTTPACLGPRGDLAAAWPELLELSPAFSRDELLAAAETVPA